MAQRRVRTTDYDETARKRLGGAVERARQAAGHRSRKAFATAASISARSLVALEQGDEGVGQNVLHAVGRALPNWTEDTPRTILEGGPIPPTGESPVVAAPAPTGQKSVSGQIMAGVPDMASITDEALNEARDIVAKRDGEAAAIAFFTRAVQLRDEARRRLDAASPDVNDVRRQA